MVYFQRRETLYAFSGDYDGFLSGRETGGRTVPAGALRHYQCTSGWKNLVPAGTRLIPGDQVQIEMDSQDIEKLYEPLVSMANIY